MEQLRPRDRSGGGARAGRLIVALLALAVPALARARPANDEVGDRVAASAQAAEDLQGPLDGLWILVAASGSALYAFDLIDAPGGADRVEGVWRDLGRPPAAGDVRPIEVIAREAGGLSIRLPSTEGTTTEIHLWRGPGGGWLGRMRAGRREIRVRLERG